MIDGTWLAYLEEIDIATKEMVDMLIEKLVVKRGVTEELKINDQFAWISAMEQIKHTAEEFVFKNIIYSFDTHKYLDSYNNIKYLFNKVHGAECVHLLFVFAYYKTHFRTEFEKIVEEYMVDDSEDE